MPTGQELYGGVATLPQDTSGSFDSMLRQLSAPSNLISDYIGPGTGPQLLTGYPMVPGAGSILSSLETGLAKNLFGQAASPTGAMYHMQSLPLRTQAELNKMSFPSQAGIGYAQRRTQDVMDVLRNWYGSKGNADMANIERMLRGVQQPQRPPPLPTIIE